MLKVWKRKFSSIYTIHVLCRSQKYNFYILYSQCWMLDVSMDVSVLKRRKCGVVVLYFCWKGDLSDSCTRLPLRPRLWLRPPGPWRMWEKLQTNYIEPGCCCCRPLRPPILGQLEVLSLISLICSLQQQRGRPSSFTCELDMDIKCV